ncbi:MAG: sodium:solute symporter family protein [Spirochaetes bacterium]|jgi:SSS family solute:Na+ symporter|nr:sodium:solute symporter family protein [Spirochaetota bacterium]
MNYTVLSIIILLYLSVMAYLGYRGYSSNKSSSDYMLAGRNTHPFIMAMSYGATFISTSAIVGFGGVASLYGMSLMWLCFANIFIGIFIAFVVYGKRTRRMGLNLDAHTFPELMGRRFDSRFIQVFAGLMIFLFMPLYAAAVLIGAARIIESFLGVPYELSVLVFSVLVGAYVILGGLRSVMYSDAVQGTLIFAGMLTLLIFSYVQLGGVFTAHSSLTAMADAIPDNIRNLGVTSWTSGPVTNSPLWWVIFSSLVLGVGIGVLSQPQLVVRFMTVKSDKELNRAVAIGAVFIFVTVGTTYLIGPLSNVVFFEKYGQIAFEIAGKNLDRVIPVFIGETMPVWFVYLFMMVILSAAMSTLSSQYHAIGTSISRDILEYGLFKKRGLRENTVVLMTRLGILISLIITIILSLELGAGIIARATAIFFGLMASCFLSPYTLLLFWKKITVKGAISGILGGFFVSLFAFLFLHGKEAAIFGLSKALFGTETLLPGIWAVVDPIVFALPVSALLTFAVSLVTRVENHPTVTKAFKGITEEN